jgi:hypothetical protein
MVSDSTAPSATGFSSAAFARSKLETVNSKSRNRDIWIFCSLPPLIFTLSKHQGCSKHRTGQTIWEL